MLFSFNKVWKTIATLIFFWLSFEFLGFEFTTITLLVLLLIKNTDDSVHLI